MSALVPVPKHLRIGAPWGNLTVFEAVRRAFPELTPREIFRKARHREVLLNAERCAPLDKVREDDVVTVVLLRPPKPASLPPERVDEEVETPAGPFRIVREDRDLLVVSKPSGCASHPAVRHGGDTLIERVRSYLGVERGDDFQPALANRLDVETSGLVLIGKNRAAQARLGRNLQKGLLRKEYLALVGGWTDDAGEIAVPLMRRPDSRDRGRRASGRLQEALTRYRTTCHYGQPLRCSLLEIELLTGRTHQIRLHLCHLGHPLAGDRRYGDPDLNLALREAAGLSRMFLHAFRLRLQHPTTGEPLDLNAPLPEDLASVLRSFAPR